MKQQINYGQLMQKAMRGMLTDVLSQVAKHGLPGDHHFFITFSTTHPGVDMADYLRKRYPEEMTIVIQEWFADLAVMKDRFTITLNFGDTPEPLVIPLDSVKTFVDPSVEFGLRFEPHESDGDQVDPDKDAPPQKVKSDAHAPGEVVSLDKFRKH